MNDTWLILDCNFLCYRTLWSIGELSHNGIQTGVAFGFLSDMLGFQTRFEAQHVIFCFDSKQSKRKKLDPLYKSNRHIAHKDATPEEIEAQKLEQDKFYGQVYNLRTAILPSLGYEDKIMMSPGYEADDWIAKSCSLVLDTYPNDKIIIVSGDHDLLQCLSNSITMYNPNQKILHTLDSFYKKYEIIPTLWPKIKAIAGCPSDNIKGVPGVGEKSALLYMKEKLPRNKRHQAILDNFAIINRNMVLTKLPLKGLPDYYFNKAQPNNEKWRQVTESLGMTILTNTRPQVRKRGG